jgi:hypothetical protein
MSKLVKTGKEISNEILSRIDETGIVTDNDVFDCYLSEKYLVLPDGLDKLEEMLRTDLVEYVTIPESLDNALHVLESVFSRFKKDIFKE